MNIFDKTDHVIRKPTVYILVYILGNLSVHIIPSHDIMWWHVTLSIESPLTATWWAGHDNTIRPIPAPWWQNASNTATWRWNPMTVPSILLVVCRKKSLVRKFVYIHWWGKVIMVTKSSVGNSHRSAGPRPTTLEEDQELFIEFSSISCLWFEIKGMRTYNFLTEFQTLTKSAGYQIDGLVQERYNSSALAVELHLSCTNPSIYWCDIIYVIKTVTWLYTMYSDIFIPLSNLHTSYMEHFVMPEIKLYHHMVFEN